MQATTKNSLKRNSCGSVRQGAKIGCSAPCPGHGTTNVCPPLIVLAVLSQEQTTLVAAEITGACR